MSAAPIYLWPSTSASSIVAADLVTTYRALACAAVEAAHLVSLGTADYLGAAGWDLELGIDEASTAVGNAVCVHDLAKFHPFWSGDRQVDEAAYAATSLSPLPFITACRLVQHLRIAYTALQDGADDAARLVQADHHYARTQGYVGEIGWDLETAIDDARIAIRDSMRVGDLARLDPFWAGKL
ncbi:hypothetical protein [Mycobacteroides abscessus]|uniref:hypothetical protein n=1 Tax=Mycobacteroides abscessus TaxID=36809 RepID=UPI0009A86D44|nr:hypothetical protein [Mycobacteroides abscessus]SKH86757.1 Uncharacterised protein [Mycobacteroides abscessus subsp. massiliense]SKH91119.1 Uncharacterised protein [Mycobacteroides abscessus subsp. massiliense]SKI12263.1 Uncharacterised protein [Mycobacteroides abscessus subsp. massiliense]SKK23555.1 Uncharacterised protein [Mycobacteroides abscessus subsp. massiliense]SKK29533.1 Uncharacterised protein [Mycobacteroides abscessus subsp. massiliense]